MGDPPAMDGNWPPLVVVANDWDGPSCLPTARRRRFAVELDRNGLFLSLGRTDFYLCMEPGSTWSMHRASGELEMQAWRLHLIIGRAPKVQPA
jgi:hypothetical protein